MNYDFVCFVLFLESADKNSKWHSYCEKEEKIKKIRRRRKDKDIYSRRFLFGKYWFCHSQKGREIKTSRDKEIKLTHTHTLR